MADGLFNPSVAGVSQYVNLGSSMSVASLLSSFPPSVAYQGWYARVSDLYGSVDDIMRCRFDGVNYNWIPQRDSFAGTTAVAGGAITLLPLVTPPTLRSTATTLTANTTVTPSATNAYVGQRFRFIMPSTVNLGVFTSMITGLIGSNISLLSGSVKDIEYGSTGWFQSS